MIGRTLHQRIAVPNHKALRIGTLNGILRAVANHKGVAREEILGRYANELPAVRRGLDEDECAEVWRSRSRMRLQLREHCPGVPANYRLE